MLNMRIYMLHVHVCPNLMNMFKVLVCTYMTKHPNLIHMLPVYWYMLHVNVCPNLMYMFQVRVCTNMTNHPSLLTDRELDDVTAVFRSFETGLREATIDPKVSPGYSILG